MKTKPVDKAHAAYIAREKKREAIHKRKVRLSVTVEQLGWMSAVLMGGDRRNWPRGRSRFAEDITALLVKEREANEKALAKIKGY